jgi:hypothetical protein
MLWPVHEGQISKLWSLDHLFAFLSELEAPWHIRDAGRWHKGISQCPEGYFQFSFDYDDAGPHPIYAGAILVIVPNRWTHCIVKVSREWIEKPPGEWTREVCLMQQRSGRPRSPGHGLFSVKKKISYVGTSAHLRGEQMLRCELDETSNALRYVVNFLNFSGSMARSNANPSKKGYLKFLYSIINARDPVLRFEPRHIIETQIKGTLKLWVKQRWMNDQLEMIVHEGSSFSIVHGCWIHPNAPGILRQHEINKICCLMMDTTWSIMRQYVTAILIGISHNTAIPLAFSFGPVEDAEIYDTFLTAFRELFEINLAHFILESDQGSGLAKLARAHGMTQRFCLRHFLATLQDHIFSVFVHFLVKARTDSEFSLLCREYPADIQKAIDKLPDTGLQRARKEFRKAGLDLVYIQPGRLEIRITDLVRWRQVSSISKIREGWPMTTNALESINGHRNEATPRRNSFWMSILRIARSFDRSIVNYSYSVRRNFNNATRRAVTQMRAIGSQEMLQQQLYYKTNATLRTCECGFSEYFSRLFNTEVPCCHLLSAGLPRPVMTNPPILQQEPDPEFHFSIEKVERLGDEPSMERKDCLISMVAHSIKHLLKSGAKMEVLEKWVKDHFPQPAEMTSFVLNIPVSVLKLISSGVIAFRLPTQGTNEAVR